VRAALAATVAAVSLVATATTPAGTQPGLAPVRSVPLTLRGTGFAPRERVRLTAFAARAAAVAVVASAQGRFVARLPVAAGRCTLWVARAVGPSTGTVVHRGSVGACASTPMKLVGTGVAGTVTRGPITPVCVAEQPCDGPAPGIRVSISQQGAIVERTTTAADGTFAVALFPGRYLCTVAGRAPSQTFDVETGDVTHLDVRVDTGIR
jgi:hypothetical protein